MSTSGFHEAHFCNLHNSQSNVYGLAKLCLPGGIYKILLATLRGNVISVEFQQTRPSSREIHFTYIPGDAEIVSIDAFTKVYGSGLVVGISFIKFQPTEGGHGHPCQVLNIYSGFEQGSEYHLDSIAQGCQNIELDFVPYKLYHAELVHAGNLETVFLLSGSDHRVHLFREDRQMHQFREDKTETFFPEFSDLPSSVTWMHCQSCQDAQRRLTAAGCQNGYVRVTLVNTQTQVVLQTWEIQHDSPIVSVELFTLHTEVECPHFLSQVLAPSDEQSEHLPEFHLLVVSAIELAVVYRNVLEKGFSEPLVLANSDKYDCTMCALVADIDMDGQNEILLGTYGHELLAYKFQPKKTPVSLQRQLSMAVEDHFGNNTSLSSEESQANDGQEESKPSSDLENELQGDSQQKKETPGSQKDALTSQPRTAQLPDFPMGSKEESTLERARLCDGSFALLWQRSFPTPLLGLREVDITGDGLREIVVLSVAGLHILQHDINAVSELCLSRLKEAAQIQGRDEEDVFNQLLSENLT